MGKLRELEWRELWRMDRDGWVCRYLDVGSFFGRDSFEAREWIVEMSWEMSWEMR